MNGELGFTRGDVASVFMDWRQAQLLPITPLRFYLSRYSPTLFKDSPEASLHRLNQAWGGNAATCGVSAPRRRVHGSSLEASKATDNITCYGIFCFGEGTAQGTE